MHSAWHTTLTSRIDRLEAELRGARSHSRELDEQVRELDEQVRELGLLCEGLWNLLGARSGLAKQELLTELARLEERAAKEKEQVESCHACGRPLGRTHAFCQYCLAVPPSPVAEPRATPPGSGRGAGPDRTPPGAR